MYKNKFKLILLILSVFILSGCSAVRIDTENIDSMVNVILSKKNTLFNQVGQGYKYYLPGGVNYINSDDTNDILYSNGTHYYLYINAIDYYYENNIEYKENNSSYYSRKISKEDGFEHEGYLEINEYGEKFHLEFVYNYAKIEAIVTKDNINEAVLNSTYILSTIKYTHDIIELMLNEDYFTNKLGAYDEYDSKDEMTDFDLEEIEEG